MPTEHRIVSLIASATEIVAALGFEQQLVGRSHECDFPPAVERLPACSRPRIDVSGTSRQLDGRVKAIVRQALSVYEVDVELLDRLEPTVIVTQTQCEVCAVSLKDVEAAVCRMVGSRPRIVSLEPNALADLWTDIRLVADALGKVAGAERRVAGAERSGAPASWVTPTGASQSLSPSHPATGASQSLRPSHPGERAEDVIARLQSRLAGLRAKTAQLTEKPTIACLEWIDPLMAAGNWVPELVEIAGGVNLFGEAGRHSPYMTWDDLVRRDPDVIAIMPCGFDIERSRQEMGALTTRPEWPRLKAVCGGRVFLTDGNQYFNRPGPRLVESAEILAELLHPGEFKFGHEGRGWCQADSA